jgi:Omp85 superfamily domain
MVGATLRSLASAVVAAGISILLGGAALAEPGPTADAGAPPSDPGSPPADGGAAPASPPAPAQPVPPPSESPASPSAKSGPGRPPAVAPAHRELNIVPIAGGDSDVGLGFGEVSDWAGMAPGYTPYKWRLESEAFITFKTQEGGIIIPFQDYSLLLTLPDLAAHKRLRLDIRGAFTDEATLKFYGIGNATPLPPPSVDIRDTEYGRIHPTLTAEARFALTKTLFLRFGEQYTYNRLTVRPTTLLAADQSGGSPEMRSLLSSFGPHSVDLLEAGIEYDSRDSEIVTRRGMFHQFKARFSPRIGDWLPYGYQQLDADARFYFTPVPRWLTVTWRLVGDALLGSPPFYELARFDETPALGGVNAVRGVPAQRYYGKVKVFENLELRSEIWPFRVKKKQLILGLAAFLDAGRVWTEISRANPDLDGTGFGIKYGVGGGLRVQEGQTFVVRLDLAWSPDATPIGAYFAAGEIF